MRTRVPITGALLLLAAAMSYATAPTRFRTESSSVTVKGTSTLHAWEMKGTTINGEIDIDGELLKAATPEVWKAAGERPATVTVTIPVASIRSEHSKMDILMQSALKAGTNPAIRYQLTSAGIARGGEASFVVRTRGNLTIAGTTREVSMDVTANRSGNKVVFTGSAPIRMTDFGINPPSAMLGTIKTGNDVTVTFAWTVTRSE